MARGWARNDPLSRWELRVTWRDEPRQRDETRVLAWVTDEFIERTDRALSAAHLYTLFDSVPPPYADLIPPPGAVTVNFREWADTFGRAP